MSWLLFPPVIFNFLLIVFLIGEVPHSHSSNIVAYVVTKLVHLSLTFDFFFPLGAVLPRKHNVPKIGECHLDPIHCITYVNGMI